MKSMIFNMVFKPTSKERRKLQKMARIQYNNNWRRLHPDYQKQWRINNPDKVKGYNWKKRYRDGNK